jgi:DedD protein
LGYNSGLETPLKHRLVGAAILVVIVVLLVPELLRGPRAPQADSVPSTAGGAVPVRSFTIELKTEGDGAAAATEAAPSQSAPPPALAGAPAAMTGPARVQAPPAPPAVAAPGAGKPAFAVQIGSFARPDSAARLVAQLRAQGFSAYLSRVVAKDKNLYRVRVGPVAERAAADALRQRLRAAGQSGSIVADP